tara:strand:- start:368 stop:982 length:615 start_codon:yes stop_codon:yes gene_type:complete
MKPTYYAVIPAPVRYANIKANSKLLYGEISALSNKYGFCFATNNYFAELYSVSKNTVSLWLRELKENNFITIEIIYNDKKQIINRKLGIIKNDNRGITKKHKDNTTSINNTSINIDIRLQKFKKEIDFLEFADNKDKKEFFDYWTEKNKSKTKMRFELEKTWDTNLRLKRWVKSNWNKKINKKSKIKNSFTTLQKAKEILKGIK